MISQLSRFKASLKHAFMIQPETQPLSPEDFALLEKIATTVADRRMAGPALLFLESTGPLNFLSSQALHFLTPILDLACEAREIEQAARLLERRDAIPHLIDLIEAKSSPGGAPAR